MNEYTKKMEIEVRRLRTVENKELKLKVAAYEEFINKLLNRTTRNLGDFTFTTWMSVEERGKVEIASNGGNVALGWQYEELMKRRKEVRELRADREKLVNMVKFYGTAAMLGKRARQCLKDIGEEID